MPARRGVVARAGRHRHPPLNGGLRHLPRVEALAQLQPVEEPTGGQAERDVGLAVLVQRRRRGVAALSIERAQPLDVRVVRAGVEVFEHGAVQQRRRPVVEAHEA